ncbi:GNAT family N-acetyltransferase [Parasphingorhabdus marina]
MTRRVSIARPDHLDWLLSHDRDVSQDWVERCIMHKEYLILQEDGLEIGFIRWSSFWGKIPYMDMIFVLPSSRTSGAGKLLYRAWEKAMADRGAGLLMTSCERDEQEPLRWHMANGFEIVGEVAFPGFQNGKEVFLAKILV